MKAFFTAVDFYKALEEYLKDKVLVNGSYVPKD